MKRKTYSVAPLILAIFILCSHVVSAQVEGISIVSAENYFLDKDYRNALIGFEDYLQGIQFNRDVAYKAGICATRLGIGKKGIYHIINAKAAGKSDNYLPFWLGRSYHLDEQWDSASKYLEQYLEVFPIDKSFKREADLYLKQIELAKSMTTSSLQPIVIEDMGSGINSVYSEFHPMLTQDGKMLVYSSRKKGYMEEKLMDDGEYKEKVFMSRKQDDGTWSKGIPIRLVEGRNKDLDYLPIQLLDGDTKLLLCKIQGSDVRLFISEYVNESWKLPYQVPMEQDSRFFTGDIIFSNDLKKVVFTMDGNTNKFQNDLYTSTFDSKSEKWSEPTLLGKSVDSNKDEAAPFFIDEKTLVFSSKSENGLGDFDLFKTEWDEDKKTWKAPVNMGFPYNTPNNDFYFFTQAGKSDVQYFSSVRGSTRGQTDIYKVMRTAIVDAKGMVKDETGKPVLSANLMFDDPENYQNIKITTNAEGRFAGKLVAGQTYLVHFERNKVLLEGVLKIPFPADLSQLVNLEVQLVPKAAVKSETESGNNNGE
jgi:WD40-like Beta Propeller Repeat